MCLSCHIVCLDIFSHLLKAITACYEPLLFTFDTAKYAGRRALHQTNV